MQSEEVLKGRDEIVDFLTEKWEPELACAPRKNLWCFEETGIAVRFQHECHDRGGQWWRSWGNERWEFNESALLV